jgi:signal transduction histidine kinase
MTYRDLILGRNVYIPSRVDYKIAMLRSHLALLAMFVGISYIFIDRQHGIYDTEPYYIGVAIGSFIILILNRLQRYQIASIFSLTLINLLVFYFASIDPAETGVLMYFVVSSLTAFALLGYRNLKLALVFILLSVTLFLISYWVDIDWITERTYSESYLRISYTINFLASLLFCIAIMFFQMDVNHHSEKQILAKNEQLEKANAELDRFVYSASHDLKAPLSSLLGLIEIAQLDQQDISNYLKMMKIRIHDMENFIREIINYSRNSRLEVEKETTNLRKIVFEVTESLRYSEHRANIVIENKVPENLTINTDVPRLKVVLTNLISNSLKYYDEKKPSCYVRIEADERPDSTIIYFKDNGIGIDPQYLEKIFNMFFRASEKSKGSGLGLYITKETLAKINGTITVQSTLGEGSTFIVTLAH